MDLSVGIFADPIYLGRLNSRGKETDKHGILRFSQEEWDIVSGSSDLYVLLTKIDAQCQLRTQPLLDAISYRQTTVFAFCG